jgi:uncharacterized protein (DUF305 family)
MALRVWLLGPSTLAFTVLLSGSPVSVDSSAMARQGGFTPAPVGSGCMGQGGQRADQHFIEQMIPHHDGAIAMAQLALTRARRPEIRELARQIIASQTAENARMRGWYRQWFGMDLPAWSRTGMGMGMGMGTPALGPGVDDLSTAADFDRAFLEQMIPHHCMGVMMAAHAGMRSERSVLRDLQAVMVRVQSEEIVRMAQWYRRWYAPAVR